MAFTVLVVDDNPVQAATRQSILTYSGNNVVVATSASHALALLEDPELSRTISLIITDHLMPLMNGPQFIARLRQRFPTMPVLVLSGLPDAEIEYAGMNVLYRQKPIAPEELIQISESLCKTTLGRTA